MKKTDKDQTAHGGLSVLKQGIRYVIVGVSSAGIELIAFSVMFYLLGIAVEFASPLSLALSTVFNFILSSTWSFKGSSNMARSVVLYALLFVFNMAFSAFAGNALVAIGFPGIFAKLTTMACVVLWNFVLYRTVVFK